MSEKIRCSQSVFSGRSSHTCSRKGKLKHKGKFYCHQHFPPNATERRRKSQEKSEKEWGEKTDRWDQEEKDKEQLAAIKKIVPNPEGLGELVEIFKDAMYSEYWTGKEYAGFGKKMEAALRACGIDLESPARGAVAE